MEGLVPAGPAWLWGLPFQPEVRNGELLPCQSRTRRAGLGCRTGPGAFPVTFPRGVASPRDRFLVQDTRKSGNSSSRHSLSQQGSWVLGFSWKRGHPLAAVMSPKLCWLQSVKHFTLCLWNIFQVFI